MPDSIEGKRELKEPSAPSGENDNPGGSTTHLA